MAILTKENLVNVLNNISKRIKQDDSFEGNISYTRMTPGLENDEFDVQCAFRVDNSQGQGGMFILEPTALDDNGHVVRKKKST